MPLPGGGAVALFGLNTTGTGRPPGYIQAPTGGAPDRAPFNFHVQAGGPLGPDHTLVVKVIAWLNDTERPIHIEPTFTVVYQVERK